MKRNLYKNLSAKYEQAVAARPEQDFTKDVNIVIDKSLAATEQDSIKDFISAFVQPPASNFRKHGPWEDTLIKEIAKRFGPVSTNVREYPFKHLGRVYDAGLLEFQKYGLTIADMFFLAALNAQSGFMTNLQDLAEVDIIFTIWKNAYMDWKKAQEIYKQGTQTTGGEWDIQGLTESSDVDRDMQAVAQIAQKIQPVMDSIFDTEDFNEFVELSLKLLRLFRSTDPSMSVSNGTAVRKVIQQYTNSPMIPTGYAADASPGASLFKAINKAQNSTLTQSLSSFFEPGEAETQLKLSKDYFLKWLVWNKDFKKSKEIYKQGTQSTGGNWDIQGLTESDKNREIINDTWAAMHSILDTENFDHFVKSVLKIPDMYREEYIDLVGPIIRVAIQGYADFTTLPTWGTDKTPSNSLYTAILHIGDIRDELLNYPDRNKLSQNAILGLELSKDYFLKWLAWNKDYKKAKEAYKQGTQSTKGEWDIEGLTENEENNIELSTIEFEKHFEELILKTLECTDPECFINTLKNSNLYPYFIKYARAESTYENEQLKDTVPFFDNPIYQLIVHSGYSATKVIKKLNWWQKNETTDIAAFAADYAAILNFAINYLYYLYLLSIHNVARDWKKQIPLAFDSFLNWWNYRWMYLYKKYILDYKKSKEVYNQGTQATKGEWDIEGLTEELVDYDWSVVHTDRNEPFFEAAFKKYIDKIDVDALPVLKEYITDEGDFVMAYRDEVPIAYFDMFLAWCYAQFEMDFEYMREHLEEEKESAGKSPLVTSAEVRDKTIKYVGKRLLDYYTDFLDSEKGKDFLKAKEVYKQGTQATGGEWDIGGLTEAKQKVKQPVDAREYRARVNALIQDMLDAKDFEEFTVPTLKVCSEHDSVEGTRLSTYIIKKIRKVITDPEAAENMITAVFNLKYAYSYLGYPYKIKLTSFEKLKRERYLEHSKTYFNRWLDYKIAQDIYKQGTQATGGDWDIGGLT